MTTYPHTMQSVTFRGTTAIRAVYYSGRRAWIIVDGRRYYRGLHW